MTLPQIFRDALLSFARAASTYGHDPATVNRFIVADLYTNSSRDLLCLDVFDRFREALLSATVHIGPSVDYAAAWHRGRNAFGLLPSMLPTADRQFEAAEALHGLHTGEAPTSSLAVEPPAASAFT